MSVARFVADQRTMHRVPHTVTCKVLGISISWFHKSFGRGPTDRAARRAALDAKVRELFEASGRTYGSPRIHADLVEAGETVSVNTVANSMRRQGLQGRKTKRRRGLTRQTDCCIVSRPAAPRLHCSGTEREVVRRSTEIPTDAQRQALFRFGAGSAFALVALPARPRMIPTPTWPAMRSRSLRRCAACVARFDGVIFHSYRRIYLHRNVFHHVVPKARGVAIHGQGRFMFQ